MVTIDHSFFIIGTELAEVGMDDLTPMTHDYAAHDNKFTGTISKIVIGVGPVGEAFDPPPRMAWPRVRPLPAFETKSSHNVEPPWHSQSALIRPTN
jgi:hypothetical protein